MRAKQLTIFGMLVALLVTASCESKTGVLIETSASDGLGEEIVSLRYYLGKQVIAAPNHWADQDPLRDVDLQGRNLFSDPYRLLLTPKGGEIDDNAFVVVALGLNQDGDPIGLGRLNQPLGFSSGQVLQWELSIVPVGDDVSVTATGCLQYRDESGEYIHIGVGGDSDCDGYLVDDGDCNDLNPYQSPGAAEDCSNGIDDNCNGQTDYDDTGDFDGDGFAACSMGGDADCNDNNADIHPGAIEICDGLDNDCNGECDELFDRDDDHVTSCGSVLQLGQCVAVGDIDCNDNDPTVHPGHPEICDGLDNDCNDICDDDPALDPDGDRYTSCGSVLGECGLSAAYVDCDPTDFFINPGAVDLCDGIDNDCDGSDAEESPCFVNLGEGCFEGRRECSEGLLEGDCEAPLADGNVLPEQECTTYLACENTEPDPFVCVLNELDPLQVDEFCKTAVVNGDSCATLGSVRIVPPGGQQMLNDCTYSLIGGTVHGRFDVSLIGAESSGQFVQGCEANLWFSAQAGALKTIISIVYDDGATSSVIRVKLTAEKAQSCNNFTGLTCQMWQNAPVPLPL